MTPDEAHTGAVPLAALARAVAGIGVPAPLRERVAIGVRLTWRALHQRLVSRLSGLSLDPPGAPFRPVRRDALRVGYYLWRYPLGSETFIRREVGALAAAGVPVAVVADEAGPADELDADDSALATSTTYLAPRSRRARVGWLLRVAARRPATVVRVAAFTAATRYALEKSVASDLATFWRAVDVAMTMQALGVNHVHAPWSNVNAFVLLLASRLLGVSCSVHARAHDLHRDDSAFALREKFLAAHFVVTNTRYNVEGIRALLPPTRHDKVHLVRNGLDVERYGVDLASAPSHTEATRDVAPPRLLCVARLIEPKGLDVLLEACAILRDRGIAFACDIVGGPEEPLYTGYLARLRVLHHQLQLQSHVRFAGALPHSAVVRHYQRADLFVLPCVVAANGSRDITPNALIEAMAMRLPVIATTITAIPEIVANGTSGVLVPPGDAGALADAIERLLADEALRRRLGEEARRTVERTFDLHRNMAEYAHLFRATC